MTGGMSVATSIALSGMNAATQRLDASARNIANFSSARPSGDITDDIVQLIEARTSFAANAAVVRVDSQMTATLLDVVC